MSSCVKLEARLTRYVGIAVTTSSAEKTSRPPTRSVKMPIGIRSSEPVRIGMATRMAKSPSLRPNCFFTGMPTIANITQTAKNTVKPKVAMNSTRAARRASCRVGGAPSSASRGGVLACILTLMRRILCRGRAHYLTKTGQVSRLSR